MKKSILALVALLMPAVALSGGHSELGGYGTGVKIDTHVMENNRDFLCLLHKSTYYR